MNLRLSDTTLTRRRSFITFVALSLLLLSLEMWIASRVEASPQPGILAIAISLDIAVGVPLLFYLLIVRKKYLPLSSIVPVCILTLLAIRFSLSSSEQSFLRFSDFLIPAIELSVAVFLLFKLRNVIRDVRRARRESLYFVDALRIGLGKSVKSDFVAAIVASEVCMLYLVFAGWFAKFRTSRPDVSVHSYHRKSSFLFWSLMALVIVETFGLHLVISIWTPTGAWVFTAISIYTLLWMVGHTHASRLQPVIVDDQYIYLRTGLVWRGQIALSNVSEVRKVTKADRQADGFVNVSLLGDPDVVIVLTEPRMLEGLFARRREVKILGIALDDPEAIVDDVGDRTLRGRS
ncbi:MAG: hypothetical protein F4Y02_03875 [Chloroflexi bacterium]|nr:hypothetical protein [Chloroflexota bacterium]